MKFFVGIIICIAAGGFNSTAQAEELTSSTMPQASSFSQNTSLSLEQVIERLFKTSKDAKQYLLNLKIKALDDFAESKSFNPDLKLRVYSQNSKKDDPDLDDATESSKETKWVSGIAPEVSMNLLTGGNVKVALNSAIADERSSSGTDPYEKVERYKNSVTLKVEQKLLKGAGKKMATAAQRIAKVSKVIELLELESAFSSKVVQAKASYWNLVKARASSDIDADSLARSRKHLNNLSTLSDLGRYARLDLLQHKTSISQRELSLEKTISETATANNELAVILDLEETVTIIPTDEPGVTKDIADFETILKIARQNNYDLRVARLGHERAQIQYNVAVDQHRWDLNLSGQYDRDLKNNSYSSSWSRKDKDEWAVGVELNYLLGDDKKLQEKIQRKLQLKQAAINLSNVESDLILQLKELRRQIIQKQKNLELAIKSEELSQRQLDLERDKQKMGRSSIFQIIDFENDLVSAHKETISERIDCPVAVTRLHAAMGVLLPTIADSLLPTDKESAGKNEDHNMIFPDTFVVNKDLEYITTITDKIQ